ncbi:MAG: o-succinylbenzoate synthase, partial [Candidatus Limnocylindria bacterium]
MRVPMRHRFRRLDHREAVLIRGPAGWGEFSPFAEYPPEVAARWLASGLESACTPLPPPIRATVPVNVTVPALAPAVAAEIVIRSGAKTAKVKVAEPGQDEFEDLARVAAVREALGTNGAIRVDANGAWDVATAVERIGRLAQFGLEYVEQPAATIPEMRKVREAVGVLIAADESVRSATDPQEAAEAGAADIYVVKVQPLGGVARTLSLAQSVGLPVVVSSALETSVGMAAGVRAAATLPELEYACGLGTVGLLEEDVVLDRLEPVAGEIRVERPEPDADLLARWRPDRERAAEMLRRVWMAAELLT